MYGSNFWIVTLSPLACSNFASEAAIIPLPREEVTPPVTKMYLAIILRFSCDLRERDVGCNPEGHTKLHRFSQTGKRVHILVEKLGL
jgi:hypothetical protein